VDSTRYLMEFALPEDSTVPYPDDLALDEYDIVTIYGREELRAARTVSIAGMVNEAGTYSYRTGMTLRDLVLMARGLGDGADLDVVEIARLPSDRSQGTLATRLRVPMDSTYLFEPGLSSYPRLPGPQAATRQAPEVTLEPFDQVTVFRQPEFELLRTVTIGGEVSFPGTYALMRKDERVSDLVHRAGGLLSSAYAEGARFSRSLGGTGRVNLDLARILARPGDQDDIILQPGDALAIPEYLPTVRVEGAVNAPTSVLYAGGANLEYYIGNAGGYARNADEGRVIVRYANGTAEVKGRSLFFSSSPKPGPGSLVTVPEKPEPEPVNTTQLFAAIAQIMVSAVAIIAIVR